MHEKFNEFYRKYENVMYNISYDILKDSYLAEDAVQTAFVNLYKNFQGVGNIEDIKTKHFVVTVTRRAAIDIYRRQQRQKIREFPLGDFERLVKKQEPESPTEDNEVIECIKRIPKIYADTLTLKYIHGYKSKEIAKMFGYAPGTIHSYLFRGKKLLREELKKSGIDIKNTK